MTGGAVVIAREAGADPIALLDRALDGIGIGGRPRPTFARKAGFTAIVVPALDAFAAGSPATTDPRLVEHLIDRLIDLGAARVDLGATRDTSALWLENRDPMMVADLLGYRYETPKGRLYDIFDLGEDMIDDVFDATSVLAGTPLAQAWLEADVRIVFAANRTDEDDGYALCLATLLAALPLTDKDYHYRLRRNPGAVIAALLTAKPVELALIDATVSAHGNGGDRAPHPIATDTIVAATDPALADHYGAMLMGLDPFVSRIAAPSLRRDGLLTGVRLSGRIDPYSGWINVDPLLIEATARRRRSVSLDRAVRPLLQQVDRTLFPFRNSANDRANAAIAPLFDGQSGGQLLALANLWLGAAAGAQQAWATHFAKDSLRRHDLPIDINPTSITDQDFASIVADLAPLIALLDGVPVDETGLRWRTHDGAILFDGVRRFQIPFAAFTAVVEIARTIQYMNDYIGGSALAIACDADGFTVRQIERNLYLPQPNYTVLFSGDVIDVTKIEAVTRGPRRQQMAWKTVHSANHSAIADDGIVTFEAIGDDTLVTIWGRQLFNLPPLLAAIDLDLMPALKRLLVTDAYRRFFRRTFANLEAIAEGREMRIGRPWAEADESEPLPVERITALVTALGEGAGPDLLGWAKSLVTLPPEPPPARIDAYGFHHFEPAPRIPSEARTAVTSVLRDFQHATRVDAGLMR